MRDDQAVVQAFPDRIAAELAAGRLEAVGIRARVAIDDAGGSYPNLDAIGRGARVVVASDDLAAARRVLAEDASEVVDAMANTIAEDPEPSAPGMGRGAAGLAGVAGVGGFLAGAFLALLIHDTPQRIQLAPEPPPTPAPEGDLNGDGRPDEWWSETDTPGTYEYRLDRDFDGAPDQWFVYEGEALLSSRGDDNFDGAPDAWSTFQHGQPISATWDTNFDGTADATVTYRHGIVTRVDWHPGGTRPPERQAHYEHGILAQELSNPTPDGHYQTRTPYDPFARRGTPTPID